MSLQAVPKWGGAVTVWRKPTAGVSAASLLQHTLSPPHKKRRSATPGAASAATGAPSSGGNWTPPEGLTHVVAGDGTSTAEVKQELGVTKVPSKVKLVSKAWLTQCLQVGVESRAKVPEYPFLLLDPSEQKPPRTLASPFATDVSSGGSANNSDTDGGDSDRDVGVADLMGGTGGGGEAPLPYVPPFACQRRTPLRHHNEDIVALLHELIDYYDAERDSKRSLAFTQVAAVLKSLPRRVRSGAELKPIKFIGKSAIEAVDEIVKTGHLTRLEAMRANPRLTAIKELSEVWMVGPTIAERWYDAGLGITNIETAQKALESGQLAKEWEEVGWEVCRELDPKGTIKFMIGGGYRRGKELTSDLDIIATFERHGGSPHGCGDHVRWAHMLADKMEERGYIKVCNLPDGMNNKKSEDTGMYEGNTSLLGLYPWRGKMRRVDIFMSAPSQWAYGVLGWTGSRTFLRQMRRYASDGFTREEQVFEMLGLEFIPPEFRNT
ncbi:hypothetical protein JKP88DRAFT_350228 [Tribonema minus]|uniref:BRCT domain-containing protein n=1 Tax=Tribonema minus TaxID=303371 RepID=A0A836CAM8_9STRA|nr:hypothetical protein JKP88DRAFT_350228 [Tribonema minus]